MRIGILSASAKAMSTVVDKRSLHTTCDREILTHYCSKLLDSQQLDGIVKGDYKCPNAYKVMATNIPAISDPRGKWKKWRDPDGRIPWRLTA